MFLKIEAILRCSGYLREFACLLMAFAVPVLAAAAETGRVVSGPDGWLFFEPEIGHLRAGVFWDEAAADSGEARPGISGPLPAILAYDAALRERGVTLLVVPVPPKAAIYPDRLPVGLGGIAEDPAYLRFFDVLREHGVAVLDLTASFRERRAQARGPLYCRLDTHWSGVGCVVAAETLADAIRPHLPPPRTPLPLESNWREIEIDGDLAGMQPGPEESRERLEVREIALIAPDGVSAAPLPPDPDSPVVLLGDSHALVFHAGDDMHFRGAGLADQLAYELGYAVDLAAVRGSGATPARVNLFRRARRDPDYWNSKKVVVWCFAAREFTGSDGWRIVPVAP